MPEQADADVRWGTRALRWRAGDQSELIEQADALFKPRDPLEVARARGPCGRTARVERVRAAGRALLEPAQRAIAKLEAAGELRGELRASEDSAKALESRGGAQAEGPPTPTIRDMNGPSVLCY